MIVLSDHPDVSHDVQILVLDCKVDVRHIEAIMIHDQAPLLVTVLVGEFVAAVVLCSTAVAWRVYWVRFVSFVVLLVLFLRVLPCPSIIWQQAIVVFLVLIILIITTEEVIQIEAWIVLIVVVIVKEVLKAVLNVIIISKEVVQVVLFIFVKETVNFVLCVVDFSKEVLEISE